MPQLSELKTVDEWREAYPLLCLLRPKVSLDDYLARREDLLAHGYQMFGLRVSGRLVCIAGFVLHPHIERGREFWIHDLVTHAEERSKGYGLTMLRHLEEMAASAGCSRILVHTRLERTQAQNFYANHAGCETYAVVYARSVGTAAE